MYRVEVRYLGDTVWRAGALPLTLQAAFGQARVMSGSRTADQARVVQASAPPAGVNLRV
ncbi:hypothetical protein [Phenylobacterium sp.]|uniref:hypothetical protein n=1 Tax=Phenylobacterium sp. TaxID=1871053 RepID=UPI002F92889E